MRRLQNYKVNKKANASKICFDIVKFIKSYTKNNYSLKNIVSEISKISGLPTEILNQKVHQILYRDFNFKKNKFENYSLLFLIADFLKYYIIVLINILGYFIFNKNKKKKNFEMICDHVFDQNDVDRYSSLIKIFKNVCLIGTNKKKHKIKSEYYFKYNYLNLGDSKLPLKERFSYFFLGFKILYFSIIFKINFYRIGNLLIYDLLKSNHIFSNIKGKYYITYKFYDTSPIFNFFFKKTGGYKVSCVQKNLLAYTISCFAFSDILFTLGKGQGNICNKLGGRIKKIIPVGSLFMENDWFNKKKDLKNVPKSDVLIVGINTLRNTNHYVNNVYKNDYYNIFLDWINQLAEDFPKLKIILKHHKNYTLDTAENKKMSKSKLKILVKNKSINSTYAYTHKSTLVLSFCSTMILETLGHGKKAYFIDPGLRGTQWFDDLKKINPFRLSEYNDLKELVIKRNSLKKVDYINRDHYCLHSANVSEKIARNLKK